MRRGTTVLNKVNDKLWIRFDDEINKSPDSHKNDTNSNSPKLYMIDKAVINYGWESENDNHKKQGQESRNGLKKGDMLTHVKSKPQQKFYAPISCNLDSWSA